MTNIIDKKLNQCDQASDHLFETWQKFVKNLDEVEGGKKADIDVSLIMTEVKIVETLGRQAMLNINAGNLTHKAINSKNKVMIEAEKKQAS